MNLIEIITKVMEITGRNDLAQHANIAEGTNAATIKIQNAIRYNLWGTYYDKAVTDSIAMTACAAQAAERYCFYLVSINAAGTVTVTKGTETTTDTCVLPDTPANEKAIGAIKILTAAATTFTSGTTDLSAAGITDTYYDMDCGVLTDIVNTVVRKLERKHNFRHMKVYTTGSVASAAYTLANPIPKYKRLISAFCLDSNGLRWPLKKTSLAKALQDFPDYTYDLGKLEYISEYATAETSLTPDIAPTHQFIFRPTADAAYTVELYGYQYSPTLEGARYTTNWWTQYAPEVVVYGSLLDLEPYLVNDARMNTWATLAQDAIKDLVESEIEEEYSGSPQEFTSDYVV